VVDTFDEELLQQPRPPMLTRLTKSLVQIREERSVFVNVKMIVFYVLLYWLAMWSKLYDLPLP
jgi:hypothetical protein